MNDSSFITRMLLNLVDFKVFVCVTVVICVIVAVYQPIFRRIYDMIYTVKMLSRRNKIRHWSKLPVSVRGER